MKFREEISRPGFVIDLMSIALILGVPIGLVVLGVREFYRGHDWFHLVERMLIWAAVYWVAAGVSIWWNAAGLFPRSGLKPGPISETKAMTSAAKAAHFKKR